MAQGLGFGAGVPLLPVDTLHAVAEEARHRFGAHARGRVLDARMEQVYAAQYAFDGRRGDRTSRSCWRPRSCVVPAGWALAGNAFAAYGERLPRGRGRHEALPSAAAMLRLAPALACGRPQPWRRRTPWPLYVRDKVAQTTAERAASGGVATQSP